MLFALRIESALLRRGSALSGSPLCPVESRNVGISGLETISYRQVRFRSELSRIGGRLYPCSTRMFGDGQYLAESEHRYDLSGDRGSAQFSRRVLLVSVSAEDPGAPLGRSRKTRSPTARKNPGSLCILVSLGSSGASSSQDTGVLSPTPTPRKGLRRFPLDESHHYLTDARFWRFPRLLKGSSSIVPNGHS